MFIRSANNRTGSGFTGDVNTAFRQGRQDAYRDYIDNFNVALSADAKNNAENQLNVQRAAQNYGLNLKFDDATRSAMIDTVKDSQELADKKFSFLVDGARLDNLYPQVDSIGLSKANAETNKVVGDEYKNANFASKQQYLNTGMEQEGKNHNLSLEQKGESLANQMEADRQAQRLASIYQWTQADWRKNFENELVRQAKLDPTMANLSDVEIVESLKRSGNYEAGLEAFKNDTIKQAQNVVNAYSKQTSNKSSSGSKSNDSTAKEEKVSYGKMTNLTQDQVKSVVGGIPLGVTEDGLEVLALNGGGILLRGAKGGVQYGPIRVGNRLLTAKEALELYNIQLKQGTDNGSPLSMPDDVRG